MTDPFLMPFVAIFIACCPFIAFGFFAVYMDRREQRRRQSQKPR